MDYFFWDEIFGGRQGYTDFTCEGPEPEEEHDAQKVSVIITYVEHFTGPQQA